MKIYSQKNKILFIFFVAYLIIQGFLLQTHNLGSDEGTHGSISLFYKALIINLKNFKSLDDATEFATDYAIRYPKITPMYPPLYHILLTGVFLIEESVFLGRVLSLIITFLTAIVIYKLSLKLLKSERAALFSGIFFLTFATIFHSAPRLETDIIQILTFSLTLLYYLRLKKKANISVKNVIILGLLLALAFLTKFYSVFLPFIILIDSFFSRRKLFKYMLISFIFSLILISPYIFLYAKFKLYKFALKVASTPFRSIENVCLYIFSENYFGVLPIVFFVMGSIIWYLYDERKNLLILIWFFLPALVFLISGHYIMRFTYILMPICAISCGFSVKNIYNSKRWKNLLLSIIIILLIFQLLRNVLINYSSFIYPVGEIIKFLGEGNVLMLSEAPVHSSVYIFYGQVHNKSNIFIRPCLLDKNNLTHTFLEEWGVKYLIDQNNTIDKKLETSLDLRLTDIKESKNYKIRVFETDVKEEVNCNYICRLEGKVCKEGGFSQLLSLIDKTY